MMFLSISALLSLPLVASHVLAGHTSQVSEPSTYQRARFRWWWPGGWIKLDQVAAEVTSIADAGFGGGEIGDVRDSVKGAMDPAVYGWGEERWNDGVLTAYEQAAELGVHVDMTLGPHWPTGFPGYTPDSPETMKELVHGQVFVQAGETFSGALPLPVAAPSGNQTGNLVTAAPKLVALLAAKTTSTNESASVVEFEPEALTVITDSVDNGTLTWTAPSDGAYVVVAAYARGTGQIQNMYDGQSDGPKVYPTPGYIVDHFSEAGVQAGSSLPSFASKSNGSIFEDSLELKYKQLWTLNFTQEFQARRGYDVSPFLLYLLRDTNTFVGDSSTATKITNDFYKTITDLYVDYRLKGVTTWANSLGLKFRVQPYTLNFDSAYIASLLDIPEGESLGFDGAPDSFRVLATGRDIGGRTTILSNEIGAYFGKAYGVTWKFLLGTANLDSALGVSQNVIHGFPYEDSPSSLWPGFAPFTPLGSSSNGFADAWGPRQPQWMFAKAASRYLAFSQKLLQESGPSIDVAILNQDWGVTAAWDDSSLNDAGYSYQFPTPYLLEKHGVAVRDGVLAADGPGYRALIINNQTTMDINTAELVLSYGKAGLPFVVSGDSPRTTFSYYTDQNAADEELASIFSEILDLSTTRVVSGPEDVPEALSDLDVSSSVEYPQGLGNNSVITYRRTVGDGYLYWIYNNDDEQLQMPVTLAGAGAPYDINLWTGDVKPFAAFKAENGYVFLNVTLAPEAVATIFVGSTNPFSVQPLSTSLTSTDCRAVVVNGTVQISSNTTCSATTSTNQTVTLNPSNIPESITPSTWTLRVQDWSPQYPNATGNASVATSKTWLAPIQLTSPLVPWTNITGLENASGVGVYNTTVDLDAGSGADLRVLLHLPEVEGSWGLAINGREVEDVDWFASELIDVTDYVVFGAANAIEITVATSLWNKLISVWPAVYGSEVPVVNGVAGSVVLTMEKIQVVS
ncbi:secreted protein [Colletotrichum camelliae]|nr:secreted protein [Colletotrichum camelliae]